MRKGNILDMPIWLALSALLFFGIHLVPSDAVSKTTALGKRDQIKELESKITREKQKLKTFNYHEMGLLDQLSQLEREVDDKRRAVDELKIKVRRAKSNIKRLELKLPILQKSLADAEARGAKRLVALYKYARKGYVKILADSSNLDDFWQRLKYLRAIMETDREELEKLAEEERGYKDELARVKEQIVLKEASRDEERARLSSLRKDLEKKVIRLMKVHKEKEYYETAVKELELAAKDLRKTLLNIEKKSTSSKIFFSRFARSKGRLPFPLKGTVVRAGKGLRVKRLNSRQGIFIEGSSDAKVKAVFPGRVEFSGRLKGYGEVIIINHGSRFFTISARFLQRKKAEGDLVEADEVIGLVGGAGSSNRGRLYFEIRKGDKHLDPLRWLKAR